MSIFLEAIQRFFEPQVVSNPKLILIVGTLGLISNILGLLLFHEHGHGHSHGGAGHDHSHGVANHLSSAEQGKTTRKIDTSEDRTRVIADEGGNIADVLPQNTVAGWSNPVSMNKPSSENGSKRRSKAFSKSDEDDSTVTNTTSPLSCRKSSVSNSLHRKNRRRQGSGSRSRFSSVDDIHIHPASFRNEIIAASRLDDIESQAGSESEAEEAIADSGNNAHETSPLLGGKSQHRTSNYTHTNGHGHNHDNRERHDSWHMNHKHNKPKEESDKRHSHSDLNMKGVFLHVLGDALGNIGVIVSALVIWLTTWRGRYYFDPAISLVITFIILGSAIPLCKAASRILLQAVPAGLSVDDIKEDIRELPGIVSCHHLHVWQLSDVKLVASLHIEVEFDFKGEGSAQYMQLARAVRRCLHEYGIHSSTIQPEFCVDGARRLASATASDNEDGGHSSQVKNASKATSRAPSVRGEPEACLLDCGDECDEGGQCCQKPTVVVDTDSHGSDHAH